jgi:hypothetical protein
MVIEIMTPTRGSLADAFTETLSAACGTGRRVTFLHVPKCFGTAVTEHARRLFPDLNLDGGHRVLLEGSTPTPGALLVSSIRNPAKRFKSLVLHALRDNRRNGFCAPERFPLLSAFLRRPTVAGLQAYLAHEYWHASYMHWFHMFLGDSPLGLLRERAARPGDGRPSAQEHQLLESWADTVLENLAVCLYDDPDFMRWLPETNSASQHTRLRHRLPAHRVATLIDEVVAEDPGVLRWEHTFYDRCVSLQRRRMEAGSAPRPGRAA